jgi:Anti-sigma factor NepR
MGEETSPEPPPDARSGEEAGNGDKKKRAPDVKDHISRQLRALYDEVANQPVPDRFMDLLGRLDAKSQDE